VKTVAADAKGNIWFGASMTPGLFKFDGKSLTVYNSSNSGFPGEYSVLSISIDDKGNKWLGTSYQGLIKYNDTTWTVYDKSNSGLPSDLIKGVAVDQYGNKWIGTLNSGVIKFDGKNWTAYNSSNSGISFNGILSISIDKKCNVWVGMTNGLGKFDGQTWTVFNHSNSGLDADWIESVIVDKDGNKWMATNKGVSVLKGEGVLVDVKTDKITHPEIFSLEQNYPNPFNPSTKISFSIPEGRFVKLTVYDMLGKETAVLANEYRSVGMHTVQFDGSSLPSGIYIYTLQAGQFRDSRKLLLLK